jgi:hypothetical protein
VETGDTFAAVAKRYGTTTDLLSSANHDQLPEAGMFAAVPVAYPGDRAPVVKRNASGKTKTLPRKTAAAPSKKAPAKKTAGARTTGKRVSGA